MIYMHAHVYIYTVVKPYIKGANRCIVTHLMKNPFQHTNNEYKHTDMKQRTTNKWGRKIINMQQKSSPKA